jgi:alkylhydroperoxidase family enzyme
LTEAKVAAIDDETSTLLSARERAALRFAEKLAVDHHKVDDALWAELRAQFSEAEIIELVAHTTLYIGLGRFNDIIGLDPVDGGRA